MEPVWHTLETVTETVVLLKIWGYLNGRQVTTQQSENMSHTALIAYSLKIRCCPAPSSENRLSSFVSQLLSSARIHPTTTTAAVRI